MSARVKTEGMALIAYVIGLTAIVSACGGGARHAGDEQPAAEPVVEVATPQAQPVQVDGRTSGSAASTT